MRRLMLAGLLVLLAVGWAAGEEIALFVGEAEVELTDLNPNAAKEKAKSIALGAAVEKALVQAAPPEELELKAEEIRRRIIKRPQPFIVSFSIIEDRTHETVYRLAVEARVRVDALREAVRNIEIVGPSTTAKPQLVLLPYRERPGGFALADELDAPLRERFELANNPPVPLDQADELVGAPSFGRAALKGELGDLARLATVKDWRLLVLLAMDNQTPLDKLDDTCDQRVEVKVVDAPAAALVASFTYRYPRSGACPDLNDAAGRELFGAIMDALAKEGNLDNAGPGRLIVELLGVQGYDQLQEAQALLRNRAYVQKATLESFEPGGRVRFVVLYGGSLQQLTADLEAARATTFRLKASGSRRNLLQFTLETR